MGNGPGIPKGQKIYFKDLTNMNINANNKKSGPKYISQYLRDAHVIRDNGPREQVKVSLMLENCTQGIYYSFRAYDTSSSNSVLLGCSDKSLPDDKGDLLFDATILMSYYFEKEQKLNIKITKGSKEYDINTTLGSIIGARFSKLRKKINESIEEGIIIDAYEIKNTSTISNNINTKDINQPNKTEQEYGVFNISCTKNTEFDWKLAKKMIVFNIVNKNKLYTSETISTNGTFKPIKIPIGLLQPDFEIQIVNYLDSIIFSQKTNVNDFFDNESSYPINYCKHRSGTVVNKSKKEVVQYEIPKFECPIPNFDFIANNYNKYSFLDYIKAGVQINLSIAIDFTGSNGSPSSSSSLHYISSKKNDYELAIEKCGKILACYDYDQLFPVFGFGAKPPGANNTSMCFNIKEEGYEIHTIDKVLEEYRNIVTRVEFSGPTWFSPVIKKLIEDVNNDKEKDKKYYVQLILTDGCIDDMQESINSIVKCGRMPISIIIIGIGNASFDNMDALDADDNPLISSSKEPCVRDLVQFVPFREHKNNPEKLSEEVLEELPRQIIEYYLLSGITPDDIPKE